MAPYFPQALLKENGFETGEINEIANMAFITGQTHRRRAVAHPRTTCMALSRSVVSRPSQRMRADGCQFLNG